MQNVLQRSDDNSLIICVEVRSKQFYNVFDEHEPTICVDTVHSAIKVLQVLPFGDKFIIVELLEIETKL